MNGWSQGYRPPAVPDLVMNFTLQRLLPHHRQVLGCIRAELDLITLQGQNDHFNQSPVGSSMTMDSPGEPVLIGCAYVHIEKMLD